ncbi:MAG: 4Fe-4S ferredoxin [Elusimicrobiota bacterium]
MAKLASRKIVHIDAEKCDGCGACIPNCAEGAIEIINGKAKLLAENLCDGLGACLGTCPQDAIRVEERPAEDFNEEAVEKRLKEIERKKVAKKKPAASPCGCPGSAMKMFNKGPNPFASSAKPASGGQSQLRHWPVQLMLLPEGGPIWDGADVLLAADCVPFALPDFQSRLLAGKSLAVACPKLDNTEFYVEKLARIFEANDIKSWTIARMMVPCCGGLEQITQLAMEKAGKEIPVKVVVVSPDGQILQ